MKELKIIVHKLDEILERPEVKQRLAELETRWAEEVPLNMPAVDFVDEPIWSQEEEDQYRMRHAS